MKINSKTGSVSRCMFLRGEKHLALINTKGKSITIPISSIRITGRSASGVRLMRMSEGAVVSDAMLFDELHSENGSGQSEHDEHIDDLEGGSG
jgi:Type IIA topoisomerase (DNA gyrase/topo II, topoisomerase IV), A subunit